MGCCSSPENTSPWILDFVCRKRSGNSTSWDCFRSRGGGQLGGQWAGVDNWGSNGIGRFLGKANLVASTCIAFQPPVLSLQSQVFTALEALDTSCPWLMPGWPAIKLIPANYGWEKWSSLHYQDLVGSRCGFSSLRNISHRFQVWHQLWLWGGAAEVAAVILDSLVAFRGAALDIARCKLSLWSWVAGSWYFAELAPGTGQGPPTILYWFISFFCGQYLSVLLEEESSSCRPHYLVCLKTQVSLPSYLTCIWSCWER